MRPGVIYRILSRLTWFAAASLGIPLLVSLGYRDGLWWAWLLPLALAALTAFAIARLPAALAAPIESLRRREGFLAVVAGWLVLVVFTALAYNVSGHFVGFAEAFFESMSGYTTTGATVTFDIEALPESILFMRSLSHWIGGMGIIVLGVAILPELSVGGMQLFSAEASGFDSEKLAPRIAQTARRLWVLYLGITAVNAVLLLFGGMGVFDAVNHAMSTIATGGFSTKNASIGHYQSLYIEIVVISFMFLSGISFALQYRVIFGADLGRLFRSPEVRLYAYLVVIGIALITLELWQRGAYASFGEALRKSSFTTTAIMTTTGFGTADFDTWPDFSRVMLVGLMMIGACAGSTAGGSKVVRFYVVAKHAFIQLKRLIRPRLVEPLYIGDREVSRDTTEAILGYYLLYFSATMLIGLGLAALGLDLVSAATASISAMNSIGPGLGSVSAHFIDVPDPGLYLASFGMLLGRLEIYPVLVVMTVHFWRRG
jgi:trk system potassium uptake protein TrkH